jgi:inorganic pyrophosphatase
MLDQNEADDKIIGVLREDATYGSWRDITDVPDAMLNRLSHYFLTYKQAPGSSTGGCEIAGTYGREEAHEVIRRSFDDYQARFGDLEQILEAALSIMK